MNSSSHILLFPFMSKGHTIPIIQLARLLLRRGAAVTLLTTPANRPFISTSLSDTAAAIVNIPFPQEIGGVPAGVESTDKLPDISVWFRFAAGTKLMQPHFEQILESLSDVITFMVTDGFFGWTLGSANKYGIPRLVFYGMNSFAMALSRAVRFGRFFSEPDSDGSEVLRIAEFPWIKLKREYFDPIFVDPEAKKFPEYDFVLEQVAATSKSYGILANSFYELESAYVDYCRKELRLNVLCIGPLCAARLGNVEPQICEKPVWIQWLDRMQEKGEKVLYVAFGSQAEMSAAQLGEIKRGLEKSLVNFLWVVRGNEFDGADFEGRVRERGIVVREWVDQREILEHESVRGFFSHCGWNSVMESICAGVPILCWPVMADQPLNAVMVAEEIKVGLRVEMRDGFVSSDSLAKAVEELMEGEVGRQVRLAEVGAASVKAVEQGGSSWRALDQLMHELQAKRKDVPN